MSYRTMFDNTSFNNLYLASSKYVKKNELLNDFYYVWFDYTRMGLRACPIAYARASWKNTTLKNNIKTTLMGRGYTPAAISGLYKIFKKQLDIN